MSYIRSTFYSKFELINCALRWDKLDLADSILYLLVDEELEILAVMSWRYDVVAISEDAAIEVSRWLQAESCWWPDLVKYVQQAR